MQLIRAFDLAARGKPQGLNEKPACKTFKRQLDTWEEVCSDTSSLWIAQAGLASAPSTWTLTNLDSGTVPLQLPAWQLLSCVSPWKPGHVGTALISLRQ